MLSEYEAKRIQYDLMKGFDTPARPVLGVAGVLMIVAGLGWLGTYEWADSAAPVAPQTQRQV
jgi:hypothetical protein